MKVCKRLGLHSNRNVPTEFVCCPVPRPTSNGGYGTYTLLEKGENAPPFRHFGTTPAIAAGVKHERCAALRRARENCRLELWYFFPRVYRFLGVF